MTYLTVKKLEKLGACEVQVRMFKKLFGNRVYISRENFIKAVRWNFNVEWLIMELNIPNIVSWEFAKLLFEIRSRPIIQQLSEESYKLLTRIIKELKSSEVNIWNI
jgi:hypothetical protein